MAATSLERELKRGSAELLILALLEEQERHGYQIAQLITERSGGVITFHVTSLYPTLYRLEDKGLIEGRWVEKHHLRQGSGGQAAGRRRRYYRLTPGGRGVLAKQRAVWEAFSAALTRVAGEPLEELP
ncbi:MAG: helix-turn-helix transcriptional regulator [Vicinamibacterales bacterium]|jgi:DNA-binding PadR family transcriptional regulator